VAQLRRLREQFPNELVVVGVHSAKFPSEQLTANIRQAVMRHGIEHPVVNDAGFKTWNSYAVNAWPTLVLVDPRGRIVGETSGEILAEDFALEIQEVLDENRDILNPEPLNLEAAVEDEPERPLRYPARVLAAGERMFIADSGHHRIVEVMLEADGLGGQVTRVFGSGTAGFKDGAGAEARFSHPHGMGLKGSPENGILYVADTENHAVRAIDLASGEVRTVAGTGQKGHGRLALGSPTETPLRSPWAVFVLEQYVLIAMAGSHQIWVLINEEQLGPFAGNGREALVDGAVGEASFNQPSDLALGLGHLFVADAEASAVRAISLINEPKVMTLVGQGLFEFGDRDGSTREALLQHPTGLAFDERVLYVADTYNHKIKRLDPAAGTVQTLVGGGEAGLRDGGLEEARLYEPEGVQAYQGRLYIADTNNHQVRVADLSTRQVRTFQLKGLERLPVMESAPTEAERMEPVALAAGKGWVNLEVRLPEGYHFNPEVPVQLRVGEGPDAQRYTFAEGDEIGFPVEVSANREIPVDLAVYYCREENAALCLIHNRALALPVRIDSQAGERARVLYVVK